MEVTDGSSCLVVVASQCVEAECAAMSSTGPVYVYTCLVDALVLHAASVVGRVDGDPEGSMKISY